MIFSEKKLFLFSFSSVCNKSGRISFQRVCNRSRYSIHSGSSTYSVGFNGSRVGRRRTVTTVASCEHSASQC